VIFQPKVARPRTTAVHEGWNAVGAGCIVKVGTAAAALCERGYAGGLVFRQKQQLGTSQQAISSALPGVVTAA
jgi:hypothetical protein